MAGTMLGRRVGLHLTYHPPGSATAAAWASLTLASSKPFSDISGRALVL